MDSMSSFFIRFSEGGLFERLSDILSSFWEEMLVVRPISDKEDFTSFEIESDCAATKNALMGEV